MKQEQVNKQESKPQEEVQEDTIEAKDQAGLTEEVDDLLADIDDVLEENAQEFVNAFVQQGGE